MLCFTNWICRYVEFYLDLIASPETISLIYHLAMKLKTVRDADPHIESEVGSFVYLGIHTSADTSVRIYTS
jgi:hypothetical protein